MATSPSDGAQPAGRRAGGAEVPPEVLALAVTMAMEAKAARAVDHPAGDDDTEALRWRWDGHERERERDEPWWS